MPSIFSMRYCSVKCDDQYYERGHQYNRCLLLECDLNDISINDNKLMRGLFPVGEISVEENKRIYLCLLDILFYSFTHSYLPKDSRSN